MKYVIFGGTGSLGQATTKALLSKRDTSQILLVSRDELKQQQMAQAFNDPRLRFVIGDIRDERSLARVNGFYSAAFHFAALKHVDVAERNPEECVRTNIYGTENVADFCEINGIPNCVFSSTDKAVDPITVYGHSKAVSEHLLYSRNRRGGLTRFSVFRWGNVFGSRGSAIHSFINSLKSERIVRVTDMNMTRFWIRIEDAVAYMLSHYASAPLTSAAIPPIKAASLIRIIRAVADELGVDQYEIKVTGIREIEKIHEALVSQHVDADFNSLTGPQFTDEELRELVQEAMRCLS